MCWACRIDYCLNWNNVILPGTWNRKNESPFDWDVRFRIALAVRLKFSNKNGPNFAKIIKTSKGSKTTPNLDDRWPFGPNLNSFCSKTVQNAFLILFRHFGQFWPKIKVSFGLLSRLKSSFPAFYSKCFGVKGHGYKILPNRNPFRHKFELVFGPHQRASVRKTPRKMPEEQTFCVILTNSFASTLFLGSFDQKFWFWRAWH